MPGRVSVACFPCRLTAPGGRRRPGETGGMGFAGSIGSGASRGRMVGMGFRVGWVLLVFPGVMALFGVGNMVYRGCYEFENANP